jgi:hypothetical protein
LIAESRSVVLSVAATGSMPPPPTAINDAQTPINTTTVRTRGNGSERFLRRRLRRDRRRVDDVAEFPVRVAVGVMVELVLEASVA